jgi:hypothetical protein
VGEALTMQLAIFLACDLKLDRFILQGNSAVVIQALNQHFHVLDWRIFPIILESLANIPSTSSWEARKINRSNNFCVYSVARWTAVNSHTSSILISYFISSLSLPSGCNPVLSFMYIGLLHLVFAGVLIIYIYF